MNETCRYRIKKFQKMNLLTFSTSFFKFLERLNLFIRRIIATTKRTTNIAKEIPLSFASRLFSYIVVSFMPASIDFISRDDRFIIPSMVFVTKFTLAGN